MSILRLFDSHKRKRDELQINFDEQIQQLQSQLSHYRTEAKTLKNQQGAWLREREDLKSTNQAQR